MRENLGTRESLGTRENLGTRESLGTRENLGTWLHSVLFTVHYLYSGAACYINGAQRSTYCIYMYLQSEWHSTAPLATK